MGIHRRKLPTRPNSFKSSYLKTKRYFDGHNLKKNYTLMNIEFLLCLYWIVLDRHNLFPNLNNNCQDLNFIPSRAVVVLPHGIRGYMRLSAPTHWLPHFKNGFSFLSSFCLLLYIYIFVIIYVLATSSIIPSVLMISWIAWASWHYV